MSKQYCFDIKNPRNINFDVDALKLFILNLYVGNKKNQFNETEKIPFITIHSQEDKNICILMTSKGKKNIERIENINNKLKASDLEWENGISIGKPYEFNANTVIWWNDVNPNLKKKKWTSLRHRGPYFTHLMENYQPLDASLFYEGKKYLLTPKEEEIAKLYAKRKMSEKKGGIVNKFTEDPIFNINYWNDFKKYLTPEHKAIFKDFSKIGWDDLINKINDDTDKKLTVTEKLLNKTKNEEKKREYGYAWLDDKRESIGNFTIEKQSILYGHGENPNRGKIKKQINPEDVIINIGETDPIPQPPDGHNWKGVVHDHSAVWLAKWNDSITNDIKYIMFGSDASIKGLSDLIKYEKARKLNMHIETVRENYMIDASSNNTIKMQLGTVLYLIDYFGVRVGNEHGKEEADTVGASTLRVNNVKLQPPDHVIFDFIGKDSIRFYKDLKVPSLIYNNFVKLLKNKKKSEEVFHSISSRSINAYLKEFDKSFSAKVFRTRLASSIMFNSLKDVKIPKDATKANTKILFNKANAKVAEVLNHTRNISNNAREKIKELEEELKIVQKQIKAGKSNKSNKKLQNKKNTLKNKIEAKTDVMTVAINTSLTNYIDPRIIVSWSKNKKVDLTAIYTAALMKKFKWAIETTDKDWNWENSPLIGNQDLEPLEEGTAVQISEEETSSKKRSRRRRSIKKSKSPTKSSTKKSPSKSVAKSPSKSVAKSASKSASKSVAKSASKSASKSVAKSASKKSASKSLVKSASKKSASKKSVSYIGPGTITDYKLLLNICKNPEKYYKKFYDISKDTMDWIVHFSRYAINKGLNIKANDFIVRFYDRAYK